MGNKYAYHIEVNEADPANRRGFGVRKLNALFVPDATLFMGYTPHSDLHGQILTYPFIPDMTNRVLAILGRTASDGSSGKLVEKAVISDRTIRRISENLSFHIDVRDPKPYSKGRMVYLAESFDGTTKDLVDILSSGLFANRRVTQYIRQTLGWQRQPISQQPQTA